MSDSTTTFPLPSRPAVRRQIALRVASLTGLAASAILLVDYVHSQVFCSDHGGGCDAVRRWATAHLGAPTLPLLGVTYFLVLLILAVASHSPVATRVLRVLGLLGCMAGACLLGLQALVVHALCKFCLVVDVSSLVAGAMAVTVGDVVTAPGVLSRRLNGLTLGAAAVALTVPLAYGFSRPEATRPPFRVERQLPDAIAHEQRAGAATIVEFVDFECPYCRRQQQAMTPVLASYGDRIRLVRKNVPLSQIHPHATDAARAACCAEEQGRGEPMASALFGADDLTPEGCARIAHDLGLDMDAYRACLASGRPDIAIERDHNLARSVGVQGLPTFWIGNERFEGLQSQEAVRASVDRALAHARPVSGRTGT